MALVSYPLDLVTRVSQGHAALATLGDSVERLAQKDGNVLFFKAGRVAHRTLGKESGRLLNRSVLNSMKLCMQPSHLSTLHCTSWN